MLEETDAPSQRSKPTTHHSSRRILKPDVVSRHLIADKTKTLEWSVEGCDLCVWACRWFRVARQCDACDSVLQTKQTKTHCVNRHAILDMRSGSLTSGYGFAQPIFRLSDIVQHH